MNPWNNAVRQPSQLMKTEVWRYLIVFRHFHVISGAMHKFQREATSHTEKWGIEMYAWQFLTLLPLYSPTTRNIVDHLPAKALIK